MLDGFKQIRYRVAYKMPEFYSLQISYRSEYDRWVGSIGQIGQISQVGHVGHIGQIVGRVGAPRARVVFGFARQRVGSVRYL